MLEGKNCGIFMDHEAQWRHNMHGESGEADGLVRKG
jgi:hypothetical protein